MNRREFLIQAGASAAGTVVGSLLVGCASSRPATVSGAGRGVSIVCDPTDPVVAAPPAQWAVEELRRALAARGLAGRLCSRLDESNPAQPCVIAAGGTAAVVRDAGGVRPTQAEALVIAPAKLVGRDVLLAVGHDARGLTYALTDLADAVALADDPLSALHPVASVAETPANSVRSVMRLFASDVEDKAWFNDREFWRRYLSLLAAQRFNRFNLALGLGYDTPSGLRDTYFYFAYPFFLAVPGYDVRATNLPAAERGRNLEMLRFISDEAAARGLDFQLGLWTHAYHWNDSPHANHVIEGLTPQAHGPYCRDALALLLRECPHITGVTFRIHGESGVPEGSYGFWRTVFDGCKRSGRPVGIDLHAKGLDQPTMDAALGTDLPVTISPKFWAEHLGLPYHQAAIRPTELPMRERGSGLFAQSEGARSFLRYGYGDLLREDRRYDIVHRVWPGTQRVLLWGDPVFSASYSRAMSFCGSRGAEVFDPLSFKGRKGSGLAGGRDGYADASLQASGGDFEKHHSTYRLWGRLLFNPDARPETWMRQMRADYGPAQDAAALALAHASRILPLFTTAHTPSAANNNYWPEMYVNMSIVDDADPEPYTDTPSPKRFGTVSPLDPQFFSSVDAFVDEWLKDGASVRYSPIEVAQWLDDLAQTAAANLAEAQTRSPRPWTPAFRSLVVDVEVEIGLGRFFARKLRAAVLYALFERTADPSALKEAIAAYRSARAAWARVAEMTAGVYVRDLTYGEGWFQRGHWSDRLAAIDRDIAAMEGKAAALPAAALVPSPALSLIRDIPERRRALTMNATHTPPVTFHRGEPVPLTLAFSHGAVPRREVLLHYRHAHQAQPWQITPMSPVADGFRAAIPGEYTDTPYPVTYYFEVREMSGWPWLYPGFAEDLANQPYFLLRQQR